MHFEFIRYLGFYFFISIFVPVSVIGQSKADLVLFSEIVAGADENVYDRPLESLEQSRKALDLAKRSRNDSLEAIALNRIGSAQTLLGNPIEAMKNLQASLQRSEVNNYQALRAKNLGNIGNVYNSAGFGLSSIDYYRAELAIQRDLRDTFRLFVVHNNIGKAFLGLKFYDSALTYFHRSHKLVNSESERIASILYFNFAETYFYLSDYKKSDSLLRKTFKDARSTNSVRGLCRANQLMSELLRMKGKPDSAVYYASIASELANKTQEKSLIYISSKTLSNALAEIGDYENAFKMNERYEIYRDSIQNTTTTNELALLSYYQRLFRFRVLEEQNQSITNVARQRSLIILGLVGLIFIVILLLVIIVRSQKKVKEQKEDLERLNAFKARIFAVITHDLRSPLQAAVSLIDFFKQKLINKEDIDAILPELDSKTSNIMELLNNVLHWAEGQMSSTDIRLENFAITNLLYELEDELSDRLNEKGITLEFDRGTQNNIYSNAGFLRIIFRNLIVNAIKFSNSDSVIKLIINEYDGKKTISVVDQGIGMTQEQVKGLFGEEQVHTLGTKGEKGSGIGLTLTSDFIKRLNGELKVESEPNKGTTFHVILPKLDQSSDK